MEASLNLSGSFLPERRRSANRLMIPECLGLPFSSGFLLRLDNPLPSLGGALIVYTYFCKLGLPDKQVIVYPDGVVKYAVKTHQEGETQ